MHVDYLMNMAPSPRFSNTADTSRITSNVLIGPSSTLAVVPCAKNGESVNFPITGQYLNVKVGEELETVPSGYTVVYFYPN